MSRPNATACCGRDPSSKEILLSQAGLDVDEGVILTITRFFFQSFATPESHAWMYGFSMSEARFGLTMGPALAMRILDVLKAVRTTRRSMFFFNSPSCAGCATVLTEHERRVMSVLSAMQTGHSGHAQTELMMLYEGNDIHEVFVAFERVAGVLPERGGT